MLNALLLLGIGIYVLYRNPQSPVNRFFFFYTLVGAALDFVDYNFRVAYSYQNALMWGLGYVLYPITQLVEALFFTHFFQKKDEIKKAYYRISVIFVGIAVSVLSLIALYTDSNIHKEGLYWTMNQGQSVTVWSDNAFIIWGIWTLILTIIFGVQYFRRTLDPVMRKQVMIVAVGYVASLFVDLPETLSWFTGESVQPFIISSVTVYATILAFTIIRYDMFAINASSAAETVFTTTSDGILLMSSKYRLYLANRAMLSYLGLKHEDIVGKDFDTLIKSEKEHLPISRYVTEKLGNSMLLSDIEGFIQTKKAKIPVSLSFAPLKSNWNDDRGVICIVRDITERKQQERRLKASYESIRLADTQIRVELARLRAILSSIGEGLFVVDETGVVTMVNNVASTMLKTSESKVVGKKYHEVFKLSSAEGEEYPYKERVEVALKKLESVRYTLSDSMYLNDFSGQKFPVAVTTTPIISEQHETGGSITIFDNISQEMEIDKAKSEFVSLAAHQLRVPVTAILWNLEVLEGDIEKLGDDAKLMLKTSYNAAENMSDLINQFLNVSRIELGKLAVTPEPVKLGELLSDVVAEQKITSKEKNQVVTMEIADKIPVISLDKVLMRVVFQNLVSNAFKYTPKHGTVTIKLIKEENAAVFIIADTGIGIPVKQQENLFTKLFRADNAKKSGEEGNGLGLYLVKSVVQLANGDITFVSEEGKGTTFTVRIPYTGMEAKEGSRSLIM